MARAQVGGLLTAEQRKMKAAAQAPTAHSQEPRRIKAGEIVQWYRQQNGLSVNDPIKGSDVAEAYFRSINYTPQNG